MQSRPHHRSGVTLLEAMATTVLLSLATASALFLVPSEGNDRRELRDVMTGLETRLEAARDMARISGQPIDVRLRNLNGWTVIEVADVDSSQPPQQYRVEPSLDTGNRSRSVTRAVVTGTPRRFQFQGLGQAGDAVSWDIRFGDARARLQINPLSGEVETTIL